MQYDTKYDATKGARETPCSPRTLPLRAQFGTVFMLWGPGTRDDLLSVGSPWPMKHVRRAGACCCSVMTCQRRMLSHSLRLASSACLDEAVQVLADLQSTSQLATAPRMVAKCSPKVHPPD